MLDKDLTAKIKRIQFYTSHLVSASFAGEYESVFKGRGIQFEDVREYVPGDDVRDIDWNVTARESKPYVKRFVEERENTVILAVDVSASGEFGTNHRKKNELAAEISAVLAFAATRNNDKVGLLMFSDRIELFVPPRKGRKHVLRIIREILSFSGEGVGTDISSAVDYVGKIAKKRATVFLISDFPLPSAEDSYIRPLSLLKRRHDVVGICVQDRMEKRLPAAGLIDLQDLETGKTITVDCSDKGLRRRFEEMSQRRNEELQTELRGAKIDFINVETGEPYINDFIKFFHMRRKRR
ncbi:DUF58 domain-containing protein [Sedimentisphaera salicampi]|uniref:DUF58 domain-containing protein n=1 Tax=Sedimentisphaera salicampi TaxID=1941349 RepID=UPI000B9BCF5D|nr:DUF58 domain-containing protein [Sedimentisphaera salicampi]OXU15114.1 hypothetical protein SMSP1_01044 [Sedimentisphaera salicampi]